jgi:hypothetical protein
VVHKPGQNEKGKEDRYIERGIDRGGEAFIPSWK